MSDTIVNVERNPGEKERPVSIQVNMLPGALDLIVMFILGFLTGVIVSIR